MAWVTGWQKMMRRLWVRLSEAFLLLIILVIGIVALVMNRTIETSFQGYVNQSNNIQSAQRTVALLENYYRENNTWEGVGEVIPGPGNQSREHNGGQTPGSGGGVKYTVIDSQGQIVYSRNEDLTGTPASEEMVKAALPLSIDETPIGWVHAESPGQSALNEAQTQFLKGVQKTLSIVGLSAVLLALLLGVLLSRLITSPLALLRDAAEEVAGGHLGKTVELNRENAEEIASLTESFNYMSEALAKGERQRQQMTADIAHELRTPVSVIRAQLQAMMDGVHEPTLAQIAEVYDQSIHLQRLVEDLRTLTQAESGHLPLDKHPVDPGAFLKQILQSFEPLALDAGLKLSTHIDDDLPTVTIDKDRIWQVVANLLTNALRYTQPGGAITLSANHDDQRVRVTVSNTGVTLSQEEASRVFDRFWRADDSRQRVAGGSGLGLSIARQIVRLHDGDIWAELDADQTRFIFDIPA